MNIIPSIPKVSKYGIVTGCMLLIDVFYVLIKYILLDKSISTPDYIILGFFGLIGLVFYLKMKPQDFTIL